MKLISLFVMFLLCAGLMAHDYLPGKKQEKAILLKGGDLYTVSDGILKETDLIFENGRITQIGKNLTPPEKAEIIDVTGQRVYPGLIAPYCNIGLIEIGAVRATNDRREIGRVNPDVQAHVAYNPDSEIIPSVRANGITTALIVPQGSLVAGRSSLLNLDGWTIEDAAEKLNVGLHINWPRASVAKGWWEERSAEEQKKDMTENRQELFSLFDNARSYWLARKADPGIKKDSRWEAMIPVFEKQMPVYIDANDYRQIDEAVNFCKEQDIAMVLVGGADAWQALDLLKENDIPVIAAWTQALPSRQDEAHDQAYRLPAILAEAGIRFCLAKAGGAWTRNLPFQAGHAVGYGLSPDAALRALTLSSAEIFGVDKEIGSLEIGKKATLVVSDGDILDIPTNKIRLEFIEGRRVDLNNKHEELYNKYRQKHFESK